MKYRIYLNKLIIGILVGALLPLLVFLIYYLLQPEKFANVLSLSLSAWFRINIQIVSLCIYISNLPLFFLFNRFDMTKAARGILISTVAYTVVVGIYYAPELFR